MVARACASDGPPALSLRSKLGRMPTPGPYAELLAAVPVRTGEVAVLGSLTRYWDYGPEDADTTILAVHGLRGDHHGLEPVVAHLPHVRVLMPDLPGFGVSTPMTEAAHDVPGYGRWLRALLDALGLTGSAVVLGHSFGSIVTAHAVAAGLPTPRLVLVNPIAAPALAGPRGVLTRLAVFYYWLGARLPERVGFALLRSRAVTRFMSASMAKTRDRALRSWIHAEHDRYFGSFADRRVVLEAFRASVSAHVGEVAERVLVPTLLIAADRDDITPLERSRELATRLPHASLVVLEGVGHLIHYERPAEAAAAIAAFVAP